MQDTVIVSFAKRGREDYPSALSRLAISARASGFSGDFMFCAPELPASTEFAAQVKNMPDLPIPSHADLPYGFKPVLVQIAKNRGYKRVIWCDSTIFFNQDFGSVLSLLGEKGVLGFDNPGCPESHWTSDDCLEKMGCSHAEAQTFNQVMACVLGFDFNNPLAETVHGEWFGFCNDGVSFRGVSGSSRPEFRAHRHDQSVISYLLHKHRVGLVPYGFLAYWSDRAKFNSRICNRGIGQL